MVMHAAIVVLVTMCSVDELNSAQRNYVSELASNRVLLHLIDLYLVGDIDLPIADKEREDLRLIKQEIDQEAIEVETYLRRLPISRKFRDPLLIVMYNAHADQFVSRAGDLIPEELKFRIGQLKFQENFVWLMAEDRRLREAIDLSDSQREDIVRLARPKEMFDWIEERVARGGSAGYVPVHNVAGASRRDGDNRSTLTSVHVFDLLDDRQQEIVIVMCGEHKPGSWLEYVVEREKKPADDDASVEDRK